MCRFTSVLPAVALALAQVVYAAPGDLDPTFGVGGKVIGPLFASPGGFAIRAGVVQPDGRILFAGEGAVAGVNTITVVRLETDGTLDPTFGSGGVVTVPMDGGHDFCNVMVLQSDGRILVGGEAERSPGTLAHGDAFVLRLLTDGTLDASFGSGGIVQTSFGPLADAAEGIVRQPNGKIVIAGWTAIGATTWSFALARFEDDGSADLTFGTTGKVVTAVGGDATLSSVTLQPDGKLVVGGFTRSSVSAPITATFARYDPDGTFDASFGAGGIAVTPVGTLATSAIRDVALQPDGKIVASGGGYGSGYRAFVLRIDANGALDPSFGVGGATVTTPAQALSLQSVVVQPDGRVVAAGWRPNSTLGMDDFLLARLDAEGGLDPGFGSGGFVVTDVLNGDYATTLRRQLDGRLVAMGAADDNTRLALSRYEGTPAACGNGVPEPPEGCDDGSVTSSDGCDANCNVESGFACVGIPSVCTAGCGDGMIAGSEACDDGNLASADGCDATCGLEPGWTCAGQPSSCASICGDSRLVGTEQCDDGNVSNGDCCNANCQFESAGSPCRDEADPCTVDTCAAGGACQHQFDLALCPVCGDNIVIGAEECDDGNTADGDCCNASCQLDPVGARCSEDGNFCSNDTCAVGGVCQHEIAPDPACLLPIAPGQAHLKLIDATNDVVQFKWTKGPTVPKAAFGIPASGTPQYALCVYDHTSGTPVAAVRATASGDGDCADQACWTENGSGWRLKNRAGTPDGIVQLKLTQGVADGKSKVQVKMKGASLEPPALPFASNPNVIAQVRSSDQQCYGAVFSLPQENDTGAYRAKSD